MPNPIVLIVCCIIGATIGNWARRRDAVAIGLGIAAGLAPAFAIASGQPQWLFALLIFLPLIYWRRRTAI